MATFIASSRSRDPAVQRTPPGCDCIALAADDALTELQCCEDGSLSRRGGCFYWSTLADEAAGGLILRKGASRSMSVVNSEFDKGTLRQCYSQRTSGRQIARQLAARTDSLEAGDCLMTTAGTFGSSMDRLMNVKLALHIHN